MIAYWHPRDQPQDRSQLERIIWICLIIGGLDGGTFHSSVFPSSPAIIHGHRQAWTLYIYVHKLFIIICVHKFSKLSKLSKQFDLQLYINAYETLEKIVAYRKKALGVQTEKICAISESSKRKVNIGIQFLQNRVVGIGCFMGNLPATLTW